MCGYVGDVRDMVISICVHFIFCVKKKTTTKDDNDLLDHRHLCGHVTWCVSLERGWAEDDRESSWHRKSWVSSKKSGMSFFLASSSLFFLLLVCHFTLDCVCRLARRVQKMKLLNLDFENFLLSLSFYFPCCRLSRLIHTHFSLDEICKVSFQLDGSENDRSVKSSDLLLRVCRHIRLFLLPQGWKSTSSIANAHLHELAQLHSGIACLWRPRCHFGVRFFSLLH